MLFKKEDPETIINGLDKALEVLKTRYEKKEITLEMFTKKCNEIGNKRAKYMKKINKMQR